MAVNQIPTGIQAGNEGSLFSAPSVISLDGSATYLVPAGDYYLYGTNNDVDLEIITDKTTPTWTNARDGADTQPLMYYFHSDGVSVRLKNTGVSAAQTGSLIKVG